MKQKRYFLSAMGNLLVNCGKAFQRFSALMRRNRLRLMVGMGLFMALGATFVFYDTYVSLQHFESEKVFQTPIIDGVSVDLGTEENPQKPQHEAFLRIRRFRVAFKGPKPSRTLTLILMCAPSSSQKLSLWLQALSKLHIKGTVAFSLEQPDAAKWSEQFYHKGFETLAILPEQEKEEGGHKEKALLGAEEVDAAVGDQADGDLEEGAYGARNPLLRHAFAVLPKAVGMAYREPRDFSGRNYRGDPLLGQLRAHGALLLETLFLPNRGMAALAQEPNFPLISADVVIPEDYAIEERLDFIGRLLRTKSHVIVVVKLRDHHVRSLKKVLDLAKAQRASVVPLSAQFLWKNNPLEEQGDSPDDERLFAETMPEIEQDGFSEPRALTDSLPHEKMEDRAFTEEEQPAGGVKNQEGVGEHRVFARPMPKKNLRERYEAQQIAKGKTVDHLLALQEEKDFGPQGDAEAFEAAQAEEGFLTLERGAR